MIATPPLHMTRGRSRLSSALLLTLLMTTCTLSVFAQTPSTPAAPDTNMFDVSEYRVLGNSLLDIRAVERAVYPFLGPNRSLSDVQKARDALAAEYRKAGYGTVVVDIPEQSVDSGIVRLRVTEGTLQSLHVSGAQYYSERRILNELPALKVGTVPKLPELQSELNRLANEAADRKVTPVLKSGTETGTVAVDLKVNDQLPLHGSLELDNNNTPDTKPLRTTGIISYQNMFQRAESLSIQFETAPEDFHQVELLALTYAGRTSIPELTWSAYGIRSNSNVAAVGTLSVIGDGTIGGFRLNRALTNGSPWSDSLSVGVDYKDFTQNVHLVAASAVTPIHYWIWSAAYNFSAQTARLLNSGSLSVNFGIRGVDSKDADFEFNRAGAQANFVYLRGSDVFLYKGWRDSAVQIRLNYQYSGRPLVENEQFSVGGTESVRGYYEAEALVDSGLQESLEMSAPPIKRAYLGAFAFFDAAQGNIVLPLPDQISHYDLASAGLGIRTVSIPHFDGTIDWAHVLKHGTRTPVGANRVKFEARYSF